MIRVVLGGNGFDTFTPSEFTDSYVKLVFVADDVDVAALPQPLTLDSFNDLPAVKKPVVRTDHRPARRHRAPARSPSTSSVHGDHGVAGPWAASGAARPAAVPDGPQRRLRARPRRRLAPAGRRRDRAAGDQRRAGSVARQRNRPGLHRGRRPRGRDRADRTGRRADQLDSTAAAAPTWSARTAPATMRRWSRRSRPPSGCPGRCTSSSTVRRRPSCTTCGPTSAKSAASTRNGRPISGYWRRGRTEETFRQWKKELAEAEAGAQ